MSFSPHTSSSPPSSRERLWDNTKECRLWLAWVLICLIITLVWLSCKLCQLFPHLCTATAHGRRSPTQPVGFIILFNSLFFPCHIFNPILLELHLSTPNVICFTNYQLKLTVSQSPKANRLISVYWSHLHREMYYLAPKNLQFKVKWKKQKNRNRKENVYRKCIAAILENTEASTSHNISTT